MRSCRFRHPLLSVLCALLLVRYYRRMDVERFEVLHVVGRADR